jgi:serine/threonine protein kinase
VTLERELRMLKYAAGLSHVVQLGFLAGKKIGAVRLSPQCIGVPLRWVDHVSLEEAADKPQWRTSGAAACVAGLVLAMRGLHSRDLVHGDLKLGNVMIHTNLKSVTVGDLGLGNFASAGFNRYGTVGFRAPERQTKSPCDMPSGPLVKDGLALALDMWACGVTALLFACGKRFACSLQKNEPIDGTSRSQKQERNLRLHSQQGRPCWARQYAFSRNSRSMLADDKVWDGITGMLNFLPRGRLSADEACIFCSQ